MSRLGMRLAIAIVAAWLAAAAAAVSSTSAEQTGLSGHVESTLELSIETAASGALELTVTATVADTALAVGANRRERTLRSYVDPVTRARTTVPPGSTDQTITFGPVGP